MLSVLFCILCSMVFVRLALFGLRAAWAISKLLLSVVLVPVVILFIFFKGLVYIAWPLLLIAAIYSFVKYRD